MKKKTNKELFFERFNKVAGIPLNESIEDEITNEPESNLDIDTDVSDNANANDEATSYEVKLEDIASNAQIISNKFKQLDDLPTWVQDKITIADHNMVAINDWLESKENGSSDEIESNDEEGAEMETDDVKISDDDLESLKNDQDDEEEI